MSTAPTTASEFLNTLAHSTPKSLAERSAPHSTVVKFIGYDAGEHYRSNKVLLRDLADPKYSKWYPLMEWGWDREACIRAIEAAGLPQPGKSSCFFCPSMRAEEIIDLREHYPDLFRRALALEDNARANLKTVQGLGRNYSWRERFGKEFI